MTQLLCNSLKVHFSTLMKIKGFLQCIATNKQQWCGLVAAPSCGLVAACAFFVRTLSCSNLVALKCSNLGALSCSNLAALSCSNLSAHCLQLVCGSLCAESV